MIKIINVLLLYACVVPWNTRYNLVINTTKTKKDEIPQRTADIPVRNEKYPKILENKQPKNWIIKENTVNIVITIINNETN